MNKKEQLINFITECLYTVNANKLHIVCTEDLGLRCGTREESFNSKRKYVKSRIWFYTEEELLLLAKKLKGTYKELDDLVSSIEDNDSLLIESTFDNIQMKIIEEINKAEFLIWIAVAWFTDEEIARVLYQKMKNGLDIKIIVNDDDINNLEFYQYFNIYKFSPKNKYKNLMHNKFCIIDLKIVIHGSYNWTIKAKYNKENISITENRLQAEKFAREFIKILRKT